MGSKGRDRAAEVAAVRAVLGGAVSDMEAIRALHMANGDVAAAINILLDAPLQPSPPPNPAPVRAADCATVTDCATDAGGDASRSSDSEEGVEEVVVEASEPGTSGGDWWLVGSCEVAGLSTCKGRRVKVGDQVVFGFPAERSGGKGSSRGKGFGRGRAAGSCSEIVRFSTAACGEIGRIPNEWARCLLPLVREKKIRVEGYCKSCPHLLGIMDNIYLFVSVYIKGSMFRKRHHSMVKISRTLSEESTVHPLPTLLKLLGLKPIRKAEFTPEDFYTRKRPFDSKATGRDRPETRTPTSILEKCKNPCGNGGKEATQDSAVSDLDLDNIVGIADVSTLEEMDPPSTLLCELRPYQKQALQWMSQLERGRYLEDAATTLHPCWDAYRLEDKRDLAIYVNVFSGDATTNFPSILQMSKGGILADAMGLGKTIMTIALLVSRSGRGELNSLDGNPGEISGSQGKSPGFSNKITSISAMDKLMKPKTIFIGGSLVICPMTLLGQWKAEIEAHVKSGSLSLYVHYGQSRPKDAKILVQNDIVLTTYGVLASEYCGENMVENGGVYSVHWFRIVLDEAHTIKSPKSQVSLAAAALTADNRWCLTGTPIQNNLEDIYSLLRFLRIEPWSNWGLWLKLIQKPFEEGDERGLKLVQSILNSIMLRRTKSSTDRDGRPILVLPKADVHVVYCELSVAEKDFYDALFRRSKVKFDQFVEQGRVLHNYASILELLLRLRQCCDHPFLVMSRGDAQEFSDLNKLAKRFLKGDNNAKDREADMPSKAFIQEVLEEIKKGENVECPICLEACEDAVLTPCAHRLCRECLLASWRNVTSGLCPVCRKCISKQELITAPANSRFQVDIEKNWVESSKVSALLQELKALQSGSSKSIIFSQWTAFLDLLQIALSRSQITFVRLDGTLNQQQRESVLKKFTEETDILVLLMSLKAGGVGINLTAASNAFVMDPWWNPAVEEQAVMRIHRIGQTKKVSIKRFIVKGTVEERMEVVQARKQRLIAGALTDQEMRSARLEELKMLFT